MKTVKILENKPDKRCAKIKILVAVFLCVLITIAIHGNATAKERPIDVLFDQADTNHDGVVSEGEFHTAMQERFLIIDADQNGNLTREELEDARQVIRDRIIEFRRLNFQKKLGS